MKRCNIINIVAITIIILYSRWHWRGEADSAESVCNSDQSIEEICRTSQVSNRFGILPALPLSDDRAANVADWQ